jgi:UDP-glucose 4-epimerase
MIRAEVTRAAPEVGPLPAPRHGPARPGDLRSNLVDAALAGRVLSWRPSIRLREGIAETVGWFARQRAQT